MSFIIYPPRKKSQASPHPSSIEQSGFDSTTAKNKVLQRMLSASGGVITSRLQSLYESLTNDFDVVQKRQTKKDVYLKRICEYCDDRRYDEDVTTDINSSILKFNVGGKEIAIRRSAISSEEFDQNFLYVLLSGRWDFLLIRDSQDRIFLNLDPAWLEPIINLYRGRSTVGSDRRPRPHIGKQNTSGFNALVSYLNVGYLFEHQSFVMPEQSSIECMNFASYADELLSFLLPELSTEERSRPISLKLLYRTSRDGARAENFATGCEGKGKTITVIETINGHVFGGYAEDAWKKQEVQSLTTKGFLFSLKGLTPPTKYELGKFPCQRTHPPQYPYNCAEILLSLGGDLSVISQSNIYTDTAECALQSSGEEHMRLTGLPSSEVTEIEVYQVVEEENEETPLHSDICTYPLQSWLLAGLQRADNSSTAFKSELIYLASRDGFTPSEFHTRCDGEPNTVCLVKDNRGNTVGGFTDFAWGSPSALTRYSYAAPSRSCFTFSLGDSVTSPKFMDKQSFVEHSSAHFCSFGEALKVDAHRNLHFTSKSNHGSRGRVQAVEMSVYQIKGTQMDSKMQLKLAELARIKRKEIDETLDCDSSSIINLLLEMTKDEQLAEERILLELLFIEHLIKPSKDRKIGTGLIDSFAAACGVESESLPAFNRCEATQSGMKTLKTIHDVLIRLGVSNPSDADGSISSQANSEKSNRGKEKVISESEKDEVITYNVGGTQIAILRSTFFRQAPNSTFAARFSDKLPKTQTDDMEDDQICLYDEDPVCFRRMISYLQLKDLLGTRAANHILVPKDSVVLQKTMLDFYGMSDVQCVAI